MKIKKIALLMIILLNFIHLFGCATIVSGSTQSIIVSSKPTGASIDVEPDYNQHTVTPATLELERDGGPYRIIVSHEGYEPYKVRLTTSTNGWLWGNLVLGGLIGLIVDSSTGAGVELSPEEINANLIRIRPGVNSETSIKSNKYSFSSDSELLDQTRSD